MRFKIAISLFAVFALAAIAWSQGANVSNYLEQGGARTVIGGSLDVVSGGDLDIETGAALKFAGTQVTASAAQVNAIDGGAVIDTVILCGQADENGTIYLGPATAAFGGDGSDASIGSTACDALDNATEATADAPILTDTAFKILGGICKTDGTLGASETLTFTFRSAAADTVPQQTCSLSEGESDCSITTATTTDIAAGATIAAKAVQASDNSDDNLWCRATIAYQ